MLELAAVLALSQACAPSVAPETLAAIAHVESRFDPLAIGVNRGGPAPARSRDAREAARTARALLSRGANIDLGLAQINSSNLDWLDLSVEDAFDPCRNLAAAATVLKADTGFPGVRRPTASRPCGSPCPATTPATPGGVSITAMSVGWRPRLSG